MQVSWSKDANGDWSTASNWNTGAVPDSSSDVVISTAHTRTITHSSPNADIVNSLVVQGDKFQLSAGSLDIITTATFGLGLTQTGGFLSAGTITTSGTSSLQGGSVGDSTIFNVNGRLVLSGYTIGGGAQFTTTNATSQTGQITLGDSTGTDAALSNTASGTYKIAGDFGIGAGATSATVLNAGTFSKSSGHGTSYIGANFTNTGTISVDTGGTLELDGVSNTIAGVLSGPGQLAFGNNGTTTLNLGPTISASLGLFTGVNVTIIGSSTLAAGVTASAFGTNSILNLGAAAVTLAGSSSLDGFFGAVDILGTGSLALTGATNLGAAVFGGGLRVTNTGTVTQFGDGTTIGDGSNAATQFTNAVTGTYDKISTDTLLVGTNAASKFINYGLFEQTQITGESAVNVSFQNNASGTISVASGTLDFVGGLTNAGTITGLGTLALKSATKLATGTVLGISEIDVSTTLTIAAGLTYAGSLPIIGSTVSLGSSVLSLSGSLNSITDSTITASTGGQLSTSGSLQLSNVTLGGNALLSNTGTVDQLSSFVIGDTSGKVASVSNRAGATWNIFADGSLSDGLSASSHFDNSGTLTIFADASYVPITGLINNLKGATINIATGIPSFQSTLVNAGTIKGSELQLVGGSTLTENVGSSLKVATFDLTDHSQLILGTNATFAGTFDVDPFKTTINLANHNLTLTGTVSFNPGADVSAEVSGGGTLTTTAMTGLGLLTVEKNAAFVNTGTLLASGALTIGDGTSLSASFNNAATGLYDIVSDAGINVGNSLASQFVNSGLFEKTAGNATSMIAVQFVNNGTVEVTSGGTLDFSGGFINNGIILGHSSVSSNGDIIITH